MTSPSPRPLSRRRFLAVGGATAATLVGGCGTVGDLLDDDSPEPARPQAAQSDDDRLIETALSDQQRVLDECLAVRSAHKPLRDLLSPIVDHHRAHVEILGGSTTDRRERPDVPSDETGALQRLRGLERKASQQRAADASQAQAGEFARVLAGISASQAQHVYLIEQALGKGRS